VAAVGDAVTRDTVAVGAPTRIRAKVTAGATDVQILMIHPMETGLRKDEAGDFVPARYIKEVQVTVAGRVVLAAAFGRGVSEDPLLHFRFQGGTPGEPITVAWTDNKGERRTDDALLT
jgi:sulfur-oxidizing protein SoxZ